MDIGIATDELTEQKYTNDEYAPDGVRTYKVATCEEYRYGTCYRNGYLTLIDFMTGREDETEVLADKVRCIRSISEDCFFVLADYAYFFEKSTGRTLAKTEHEIVPTKEGESFDVAIVPSDEGLYFYLKGDSAEDAEIYRIEPDE